MLDFVLFGMMVVAFAMFVTAHIVLIFALVFAHRPRWRGLAAMVLPPLAPMWGWQAGRTKSVAIWSIGLGLYAVARIVDWIR